jgi:hypothetical protein
MEVFRMRSLSRDTNGLFRRCWKAMRLLLLLAVVVASGCTKPNPASCADGHCSDPARPFCDVDGTIGGEANTCISVGCTPNEFVECRQDSALSCNATGTNYDLLQCEFGCGETGCKDPPPCTTPECEKRIIPKYLPTICDSLATDASLVIAANTQFDTGGSGCTSVVTQMTGPEICVMHYGTITIERNMIYRVTGSRALALVADRQLLIDGILDVSAKGGTGPGGGMKLSGTAAANAGGGGAGARTAGAAGGTTTQNGGAGNGGSAELNAAMQTELFGGTHAALAQKGAGAVTLISCRADASIPGLVDAGGAGGQAGYNTFSGAPPVATYHPPIGGGSGGTVVIQGLAITIAGEIYANGGGGGGGGDATLGASTSGTDGTRSTTPAGGGTSTGGGLGGAGGALDAPVGGNGANQPGAGGGSSGFILTYTPISVTPTVSALGLSPALAPNGTVGTN